MTCDEISLHRSSSFSAALSAASWTRASTISYSSCVIDDTSSLPAGSSPSISICALVIATSRSLVPDKAEAELFAPCCAPDPPACCLRGGSIEGTQDCSSFHTTLAQFPSDTRLQTASFLQNGLKCLKCDACYEWRGLRQEHHAPAWCSRSAGARVHAMRERVELTRA